MSPPDIGASAALTLTLAGATASATAAFTGLTATTNTPTNLAVDASRDLNIGDGADLAVTAGLRFVGVSAARVV